MRRFSYFKLLYALALVFVGVACEQSPEETTGSGDKSYIEPFELKLAEDYASAEIIYDEAAEEYKYAAAIFAKDDFEALDSDNAAFTAIIKAVTKQGANLKEADGEFIFEGSASVDFSPWDIGGNSDYVLAAVAYNDKIERKSEIATAEFTTPTPAADFLSVVASDATAGSFKVTVKVGSYDGNYAIIPTTQEEINTYGDVETYAATFLYNDISSWHTDYSEVDNQYVFHGDMVFDMADGWNLNPGVEFMAVVFGVEGDGSYGDIVTEVMVSNPITTLEGEGSGTYPEEITLSEEEFGEIEISNITQSSFDFHTIPADNQMNYIIYMFSKNEYNLTYTTDEERIAVIYETYAGVADAYGYTFDEFMEGSSAPGEYSGTYNKLTSESDYYVVAFGFDLDTYQPVSKLETKLVTTIAPPAITGTLNSITLSDVTFDDAKVTIDAGEYDGYYHIYPIEASFLNNEDLTQGYGGDHEKAFTDAVNYLIDNDYQFNPAFEYSSMYYFTGSQELHLNEMIWMLKAETEYYVLAAGVDSHGNLMTNILKSEMITTTEAPEFDLKIEVANITETSAVVKFTPNVKSVYYFNNIFTQSLVDGGLTAEQIIAANKNSISYYTNAGDLEYDPEMVQLSPGTDYCVVAFAYDEMTGEATSGLFTKSFSTTGEASSSAPQAAPVRERVAQQATKFSSLLAPSATTTAQMKMELERENNAALRIAKSFDKTAIYAFCKIK